MDELLPTNAVPRPVRDARDEAMGQVQCLQRALMGYLPPAQMRPQLEKAAAAAMAYIDACDEARIGGAA